MLFRYKGIDKDGKKVRGTIEAISLDEAKHKLKTMQILYSFLQEDQALFSFQNFFSKRLKIPTKELASLSRELAMYLKSGISIVQALHIAKSHTQHNKKFNYFLSSVTLLLDEGESFYSALEKQEVYTIPSFYLQSIKISENGGLLDEVLLELSHFLKEQERLKKEIASAFAYPAFMIVVSLFMIAFMLTFVVPQITSIFDSMNQTLPTSTRIVIAMGDFFKEHYKALFITCVMFVFIAIVLYKKSQKFALYFDTFLLKLPFFGKMIEKGELGRFSYMASLLIRSGVSFVQTIALSAEIMRNSALKKLFVEASSEVVEGKELSKALQESGTNIDESFLQALQLGEEISELESVLLHVSELYFEENRDKTALLLTLLEPVLMLLVGGSIGFIVAAMLLPIFSMSIQ